MNENVKNSSSKNGKIRTANFSATEKELLYSLANKYQNIIENKKTDAVTNEEKNITWKIIENEFNASCPDGRSRNLNSLKKFYNNKKQEVRKVAAEAKKEMYLTGGGTPKVKDSQDDDLILSIVNSKTIHGLENPFDSDVLEIGGIQESVTDEDLQNPPPKKARASTGDDLETQIKQIQTNNWSNPKPAMLSTPTSSNLSKKTFGANRRRPATVVKTLTSTNIAEMYQELLEKRTKIADLEKEILEKDLKWKIEKQNLEKQSILLDIEIKKQTLQNLKNNENT